MQELVTLFISALLVEGVVESLKPIYKDNTFNKSAAASLLVGMVFAFTLSIDLFQLVGLNSALPQIGVAATGIMISRGSNYVHSFIDKLNSHTLGE